MPIRLPALRLIGAPLSWLGRQGTRAVAAIVLVGIFLPSIGAVFKPYAAEAIFILLCIAFLRIDTSALKTHLGSPVLVVTATVWTSLAIPAVFALTLSAFGLQRESPDLFLAMMLQSVASPMMASPALASLMGFDATLVLVTLVTSTVLIPFTAPLFAYAVIGPALAFSPLELGTKLFAILAGSALVGLTLRRIVGLAAIDRQKEKIDGANILILFVFVAALMEGVAARFLATPLYTIGLTALAFLVFFAVLFSTILLFGFASRKHALSIGFMVSQRNMGLMVAATGGALPDLTWLYFALSQFPIYLAPQMLLPLSRRLLTRGVDAPGSDSETGISPPPDSQ